MFLLLPFAAMGIRGLTRRFFLTSPLALGTGCLASRTGHARAPAPSESRPEHPVVVGSANAHPHCTQRAMDEIVGGTSLLEAVVAGVNIVEDDPDDRTVGKGGLPNEHGVVELDASVMDGATGAAGAVASLRGIRNPSRVALAVMRYTDHVLLAGDGALSFARAHGFPEEDLSTPESREIWLYWKATLSDRDDWLPKPRTALPPAIRDEIERYFAATGTIHCSAVDAQGNLAGVTSTSGLPFKIPGRVGDSPLIGAGLYVDNEVGAAGATGRGEASIISVGSASVVEAMRDGTHPRDACLAACQRIARMTKLPRLLTSDGKPNFDVRFYAVDRRGQHGGASLWPGGEYAVYDGKGKRREAMASLYDRERKPS